MLNIQTARFALARNTSARRFNHDALRHRGTIQHLFWVGPLFVALRNRKSAEAVRTARKDAK